MSAAAAPAPPRGPSRSPPAPQHAPAPPATPKVTSSSDIQDPKVPGAAERVVRTRYDIGLDRAPESSRAAASMDATMLRLVELADRLGFKQLLLLDSRTGRLLFVPSSWVEDRELPAKEAMPVVEIPSYLVSPPHAWTVSARSVRIRLAAHFSLWLCHDGYSNPAMRTAVQSAAGEDNMLFTLFRLSLSCITCDSWPKWTFSAVEATGMSIGRTLLSAVQTMTFLLGRDEEITVGGDSPTWARLAQKQVLADFIDGLCYLFFVVESATPSPRSHLVVSEYERQRVLHAVGYLLFMISAPQSPIAQDSLSLLTANKYFRPLFVSVLSFAEKPASFFPSLPNLDSGELGPTANDVVVAWPNGFLAALRSNADFVKFLNILNQEQGSDIGARFCRCERSLERIWPLQRQQTVVRRVDQPVLDVPAAQQNSAKRAKIEGDAPASGSSSAKAKTTTTTTTTATTAGGPAPASAAGKAEGTRIPDPASNVGPELLRPMPVGHTANQAKPKPANMSLSNYIAEDPMVCIASRALIKLQWLDGYPDMPADTEPVPKFERMTLFAQGPFLPEYAAALLAVRADVSPDAPQAVKDAEAVRRQQCLSRPHKLQDDCPLYRLCNAEVTALSAASSARSALMAQLLCYKTNAVRVLNAQAAARSSTNCFVRSLNMPLIASAVPIPSARPGSATERNPPLLPLTTPLSKFCEAQGANWRGSQFAHVAIARTVDRTKSQQQKKKRR